MTSSYERLERALAKGSDANRDLIRECARHGVMP